MIALDVSRLVSRAARPVPTGIDRVEFAYAEHLLGRSDAFFAAPAPWGSLGLVSRHTAAAFVATLGAIWRRGAARSGEARLLAHRLRLEAAIGGAGRLHARLRSCGGRAVYLHVSHLRLERRRRLAAVKSRGAARLVCLIHDLIPIEFPQYARPGQDERHRRRIATVAALADAVIVNSLATRRALTPYLDRAGRSPPLLVAPFGIDRPEPTPAGATPCEAPYFVCVGTIEPRKNQLMLLEIWRDLIAELGSGAPRLALIGQRGWESRGTLEMLESRPELRTFATVDDRLSDAEMRRLLRGARALLLPSLAEGFGLPLVEALALGVPVLCGNLPALRENGGAVPEYLDPLDRPGWLAAIRDYMAPSSARRAAQLARLGGLATPPAGRIISPPSIG